MQANSMMLRTIRILIVERDAASKMFFERNLTYAGYEVVTVTDSMTAIRRLSRQHYDLVLTDYELPGMSGGRLVKFIHRWRKGIPTILVSSHPNINLIAAHYHAEGYYRKSEPLPVLITRIADLVFSDTEQSQDRRHYPQQQNLH